MEKLIKIAAPFIFFVAAVCLFADTGFFVTPANDSINDRLQRSTERIVTSLEEGILPSARSVEELHAESAVLRAAQEGFGLIAPPPPAETLQAILKEWGYQEDDQIAKAVTRFESRLLEQLGADGRDEIGVFVNDFARKAGGADLFTSVELEAEAVGATDPDAPPGDGPAFRVVFSFISGVAEAAQFVETWALDPPPGIVMRPEKIAFKRIAPDIWGSSLRYYSGPPVRTDVTCLVSINGFQKNADSR
jgi:hypothetical protein